MFYSWAIAWAGPVEDLAPGPRELAEAQAELEVRVWNAEAMDRALSRLQSSFSAAPSADSVCADPVRGPLTVRIRHFGDAWHDAVQRVRVQSDRLVTVRAAPTVAGILDAERDAALDAVLLRAEQQQAAWTELVGWLRAVAPKACDLPLEVTPGVPSTTLRAAGELALPAAITAIGGGYLCPVGAPADASIAIVKGTACWSDQPSCGCDPVPVWPGAVVGPPPPAAEPAPADATP